MNKLVIVLGLMCFGLAMALVVIGIAKGLVLLPILWGIVAAIYALLSYWRIRDYRNSVNSNANRNA